MPENDVFVPVTAKTPIYTLGVRVVTELLNSQTLRRAWRLMPLLVLIPEREYLRSTEEP